MSKYPKYNKVRTYPKKGDRVMRRWGIDVGTVKGHMAVGRGFSVVVDWGDIGKLYEPMAELVAVKLVPDKPSVSQST